LRPVGSNSAQLDALRMRGKHREVGAEPVPGRAERIAAAGFEAGRQCRRHEERLRVESVMGHAGVSHNVASGGRCNVADHGWPCAGVLPPTAPSLPALVPPYGRVGVHQFAHCPGAGKPTR
jgi:hypothetical protein